MGIVKSAFRARSFLFGVLSLLIAAQALAEPIDLRAWNPEDRELHLRDDWTFYWNELLDPGQAPQSEALAMSKNLTWQNAIDPNSGKSLPSFGYGTFRLRFSGLRPRSDGYELFILSAATAYDAALYPESEPQHPVNMHSGVVGKTRDQSIPQSKPQFLRFYPTSPDEVWILSIKISNFHHYRSGLWVAPILGRAGLLSRSYAEARGGMFFTVGIVLAIGLYNLMIFLRRRTFYASLAFAVFCLAVCARAFSTSDLLSYFHPQPRLWLHNLKFAIEYSTIILAPFLYFAFVHFSFRRTSTVRSLLIFGSVAAVLCLLIPLTEPGIYTRGVILYQGVALVLVVDVLYFLGQALKQRIEGSVLAFSGTVIVSLAMVHDILVSHGMLPPRFIAHYGVAIFVFMQSLVIAKRFATTFDAMENLTRILQREVDRRTAEIRSLMDHVPLGIFMINADLLIQKGYSLHLERLLGARHLEGKAALDAMFKHSNLSSERMSFAARTLAAAIGESALTWTRSAKQLPAEYKCRSQEGEEQIIELHWHPVLGTSGSIERILVMTRNVTVMRQLQKQAESNELNFALLTEMMQADPPALHHFWTFADSLFAQVEQLLRFTQGEKPMYLFLARLARDMHTGKGMALSLGLERLAATIHAAETAFHPRAESILTFEQRRVLADLTRLFAAYKALYPMRLALPETRSDRVLMAKEAMQPMERALEERLQKDPYPCKSPILVQAAQSLLAAYVLPSMQDLCRETQAAASKLAADLNRPPPLVKGEGPPLALLSSTAEALRGALLHLASNALAHAAESPEERRAAGKAPGMLLSIQWQREDESRIKITIEDDGTGLNLPGIQRKAIELGFLSEADRPSASQVAHCIFREGVSTTFYVNQITGRGIGMIAVRSVFEDQGGSFLLELLDGDAPLGFARFRLIGSLPAARFLPLEA